MSVVGVSVGTKVSRIGGMISVRLVSCAISWLVSFAMLPYLYLSRRLLEPTEIIVALVVFLVTGFVTLFVVLVPGGASRRSHSRAPDGDNSFNTHD